MFLELAHLIPRPAATGDPEPCLQCEELVDPSTPHIFVRDADHKLDDEHGVVGLLHPHCESAYLDRANAEGIGTIEDD